MYFEPIFLGKIKTLNNQFIITKFSRFFLPVYPIQTFFVYYINNTRQEIAIPNNKTSIIAGYSRGLLFAAAVVLLVAGINMGGIVLYSAIALFILWAYLAFFFGRATAAEINARKKIGAVTGVYALPDWLDYFFAQSNYSNFAAHYSRQFYDADWRQDITAEDIPGKKAGLLYILALFDYKLDPSPGKEQLLEKMYRQYILGQPAKVLPLFAQQENI